MLTELFIPLHHPTQNAGRPRSHFADLHREIGFQNSRGIAADATDRRGASGESIHGLRGQGEVNRGCRGKNFILSLRSLFPILSPDHGNFISLKMLNFHSYHNS